MKLRSTLLLAAAPLLSFPAHACLNDRDSDALALQAQKLPETVRVITGRFERNPPLYYQMRVDRVEKELAANPHQWGLYDDIAVALDRLHRDDEALVWIEKKRAQLPKYDKSNPQIKEAWYRYYANAGTFRAHRWLQNGAKKSTRAEMVRARDEIRRAIQIKPDAHFGREKYQLMTMEWILSPKQVKGVPTTLADYIDKHDKWEPAVPVTDTNYTRRKAAIEGLTGLIVLGAAWESIDIFHALGSALDYRDGVTLRHLALLRALELHSASKKPTGAIDGEQLMGSLNSGSGDITGVGVNVTNQKNLGTLYNDLRREADTWAASRALFLNTRLEQGRHPDTDKTFWQGYKPAAAPNLDIPWFSNRLRRYEGEPAPRDWNRIALGLVVITLTCFGSLVILKGFIDFRRKIA